MEIAELEEALKVVNSCVSKIKWRLRPAAKRRLETDILALCTGLRPLIMVDYGGKMPELQEQLCDVLQLSQKESSILQPLRVMVMDDMIYLLHVKGLSDYVKLSLNKEVELIFVDLEKDPLKMIAQADQHFVAAQLVLVQKFFSTIFLSDGLNESFTFSPRTDHVANGELTSPRSSELINLSSCMQDNQVTIPTLNGWLLGYPVVYLFDKEHIAEAVYNLSTKSLRLYKILICRNDTSSKGNRQEELMSFSVPYDLSMGGKSEPWAEEFLACMLKKLEKCKQAWSNLQMEVSECYPQAVVL